MITKICSKCKEEKEVCEFNIRKNRKSGFASQCKVCTCENAKKYRKNNSDEIKLRKKIYRDKNREKLNAKSKENRHKNPEKHRQQKRDYYIKNREIVLERQKLWSKNNREKINTYIQTKKNKNPLFKVELNIRSRVKQYLKQKNITQKNKTFEIVGIDVNELKKYLESQFLEGMCWDNYGIYGWHIDHKIPLCSAKNETELLKLFHYTNLQPLWAEDNLKKNGNLI